MIQVKVIALFAILVTARQQAWAGDVLKITLPRHSGLTPVQRLNREGVEELKKHHYEKASKLFYKAYLYDPADPFTQNNLGYISELQGELERAQKFYVLASTQSANASIDRSNVKQLEGKPMQAAFRGREEGPMRVNWMNVEALKLLSENREFDAAALLRQARSADPQNPFTLNNLGVAYEAIGEYGDALRCYDAAAASNSSEPVVVTADRQWRGKQVSAMAAASARRLHQRLMRLGTTDARAATLTERGVAAVNENNWLEAKEDFLHAYSLDPANAFALNNRGFVAEMDGDLETAQYFYDRALKAGDAGSRVGLATQRTAQGKKLFTVTTDSNYQVDGELDRYSQRRHQETGPIELTPRGGATTENPAEAPERPSSSEDPPAASQPVPQTK
jgi:Flp pilus assembly protein TadD